MDWAGWRSGRVSAASVTLCSVCCWSRAAPQEAEDVRAVGDRGEARVAHLQGGREGRRAGGSGELKPCFPPPSLFPCVVWGHFFCSSDPERKYLLYEMDGNLPVFAKPRAVAGKCLNRSLVFPSQG